MDLLSRNEPEEHPTFAAFRDPRPRASLPRTGQRPQAGEAAPAAPGCWIVERYNGSYGVAFSELHSAVAKIASLAASNVPLDAMHLRTPDGRLLTARCALAGIWD